MKYTEEQIKDLLATAKHGCYNEGHRDCNKCLWIVKHGTVRWCLITDTSVWKIDGPAKVIAGAKRIIREML